MDDKFLVNAVAKMKTDAMAAPAASGTGKSSVGGAAAKAKTDVAAASQAEGTGKGSSGGSAEKCGVASGVLVEVQFAHACNLSL
jgi:hypothetical protein